MDVQRGFRDKLEKYININAEFDVEMQMEGNAVYDYSCFGVDENGKLSDDRYMVFYNQLQSPKQELRFQQLQNGAKFTISLNELPASIHKLVFTVSIDGNETMGNIQAHKLKIKQGNSSAIALTLNGSDFQTEKAIISIEIYKKDVWRVAVVASGFNGGLADLLHFYGGEEVSPEEPAKKIVEKPTQEPIVAPAPAPLKVSLKKGEKVSLVKNTGAPIIIENGWTAKRKDYDLKALVRYRDGRLIYVGAANRDEVLQTPEGAVKHGGDIKRPGELEHIQIVWHRDIASVAVSSYSALENGAGSFYRYGVFVRIKNGSQTIEIAAADTSANSFSYTLCFGEIIFGSTPNTFEVSALELYSKPHSEKRVGYDGSQVKMDIGPRGQKKS